MSKTVKYVGLDVHKNTIATAVAEDGKRGEVREHQVRLACGIKTLASSLPWVSHDL